MVHIVAETTVGDARTEARPERLQLGLWAPSLTEQGFAPYLRDIAAFEADDTAISRLHARGLLTFSQHVTAREKLAKRIKASLTDGALGAPR